MIDKCYKNYFQLKKLTEYNLNIIEADDGLECLYYVYEYVTKNKTIDCIISDESMNYMNGSQTAELVYKFITNNKVYENYRKAANLTYEGLKEDLKSVIPQIKQTFDENNIDYPKDATDDEIVEHTLQEYFKTLLRWKAGTMRDFLTNDYMESFFGFRGAKQKYFDKTSGAW